MAAQIISLAQRLRPPPVRDWSPQEVAEFYRVESSLLQAGLALESERGVSDEGDPWFVFCRADTGEVFIHFARVDGEYVVDGAAFASAARGPDFTALVRDLIGRHPLAATRRSGSNVFLHPAAILIALVGAAFFQSGHAKAAEVHSTDSAGGHAPAAKAEARRGLLFNTGAAAPAAGVGPGEMRTVALDPAEVAAVLTGVAIGLRQAAAAAETPAAAGVAAALPDGAPLPLGHAALPLAGHDAAGATTATAALAQLSGAEARGALMVMAVFADLARASAAAATVENPAAPATADAPLVPQAQLLPATPAPAPECGSGSAATLAAARTLLVVQLAEGPLPEIAAVRLLSDDPSLARIAARAVHVEDVPAVLADLISHGQLVDLSGQHLAPLPPAAIAPDLAPLPAAPQAPVLADGSHAAHDTPAAPPATDPQAGHDPQPLPAAPSPVLAAYLTLTDALNDFLAHIPNPSIMVTGTSVVFYDPGLDAGIAAGQAVESVTFRLDDGSSVSLVGLSSHLHDLHGVG